MQNSAPYAARTPQPLSQPYVWSSEYVSPGHPDKIADQISDAILDAHLRVDPHAKVACETMVKNNEVFLAGEITSAVKLSQDDIDRVVRAVIRDIGYSGISQEFDARTCEIHHRISEQSAEINKAVTGEEVAAGDQGIMFGYATRETPTRMPMAIYLAKALITEAYERLRLEYPLRPDMKAQVGLRFLNGKARAVDSIVFSACHDPAFSVDDLRELFHERLLPSVIDAQPAHIRKLFTKDIRILVNHAGAWNIGGPVSDCGLTGRKIVVDQYGADCEIGGGAFSGKDPSKVDRSAAYMARHIALRALEEHPHVGSVKVQLAYAIGRHEPTSMRIYDAYTHEPLSVRGFGTSELTPERIINLLGLRAPIYLRTARYGHYGLAPEHIDGHFHHAWESIQPLKSAASCMQCRHSVWAVGIGQGFTCRNPQKIQEGGDRIYGTGDNARFLIPHRGYSCEHYTFSEGKRGQGV